MTELINLLDTYNISTIIILFITFIIIIIGIYEIAIKVKDIFSNYYNKRNSKEEKESCINERINNLEKRDEDTAKELESMKNNIEEIKELIAKLQTNQNKSNRATCKSAMYRLSNELINKGWMTQTEYETLSDLSDVYMMSGNINDSYVRPAIIQRALTLPVYTEEEVEKIKNKSTSSSGKKRGRKPKNTVEE